MDFDLSKKLVENEKSFLLWDYYCSGVLLGEGSFAQVYQGMHIRSNQPAAIKVVQMYSLQQQQPNILSHIKLEVEIMKELNHPNIVRLYDFAETYDYVYMVMEFCSGKTLKEYLDNKKSLTESYTRYLMLQMIAGLKYLRHKKIIHRDLKPANILLHYEDNNPNNMKIKIADFTFARILETGDLTRTICGSPLYMAPEIILEQQYTDNGDLWSLGVIMYEMLFGRTPIVTTIFAELIDRLKRPIIYPPHVFLTPVTRLFLEGLLQKDPRRRFSWQMCFQHEYFDESYNEETLWVKKLDDANKEREKLKAQVQQLGEQLNKCHMQEEELRNQLTKCHQQNAELGLLFQTQKSKLRDLFALLT
jgi:serine/threonine-protein kinase ULK/ATG1